MNASFLNRQEIFDWFKKSVQLTIDWVCSMTVRSINAFKRQYSLHEFVKKGHLNARIYFPQKLYSETVQENESYTYMIAVRVLSTFSRYSVLRIT